MVEELGPSSEKKSFFVSTIITLVHYDEVLTCKSHGKQILLFNHETKLTKTMQKLSKNSLSPHEWGGRTIAPPHSPPPNPPKYATISLYPTMKQAGV